MNYITLISNGSSGEKGQDGGNGEDGQDGENGNDANFKSTPKGDWLSSGYF